MYNSSKVIFLIFPIMILFFPTAFAEIQFEEVTKKAGVNYTGKSWASSWGDYNGDSYPDLWVSNHFGKSSMFLNNGNQTFSDISSELGLT